MTSKVCDSWWAKFTSVDGEPMLWRARTFPPCYPPSCLLFYFTIRLRNRRKRTFWCHGFYRESISPPEYISFFLSILTTVEPSGALSGRLSGPLYFLSVWSLSGEGLGMQVSDNTPPSPYRCTDSEHLIPSPHNINPQLYIHHPTLYIHFSSCR